MGKKILVTGTNGYIGTSFQQYIEKFYGNMPQDLWHVTFVSMRNEKWQELDFAEYDVLLHTAALVHQKEQPDMEQQYEKINYGLTLRLAEKALADLQKRKASLGEEKKLQFVFLSTMSVYGMVSGRITADTKPAPVNFYGKTKLKAEDVLQKLASETFLVTIVRPPMIYGRACTGNYRLLEKLAVKLPFFPKTDNERSMLYIENMCEFLRLAVEKEAVGIYCPQNAEYVNTSEMVKLIRKSYGKRGLTIPGFGWLLKLFAGRISLFAKVFGTLTYAKEMSVYQELGNYQIADLGESINGSKHESIGIDVCL